MLVDFVYYRILIF